MNSQLTNPEIPKQGHVHRWINSFGCASTKKLAELAAKNNRLWLCVARDSEHARILENEIRFFQPDLDLLVFPDHETLPYDSFSPQIDLISDRLFALHQMPNKQAGVVVLSIRTLMERLPPIDYVKSRSFVLNIGDLFNVDEQREQLANAGYRSVSTVYEHGEFASRGSIFDVFPIGSHRPIRIELFDNEIESLRFFDTETQQTVERTDSIRLLPAKEFPLDPDGVTRFRNAWHHEFNVDVRRCQDYQDVSEGVAPQGVECYLPLFFDKTATFFDYLNTDPIVFADSGVADSAGAFWQEITSRYENLGSHPERPLLAPNRVFVEFSMVQHEWNGWSRIEVSPDPNSRHAVDIGAKELPNLETNRKSTRPVQRLAEYLDSFDGKAILCAETTGRREFLRDLLGRSDIRPAMVESFEEFVESHEKIGLITAPLERGCEFEQLAFVSELQLFETHSASVKSRERKRTVDPDLVLRSLTEIEIGAPVTHIEHGIGRYRGLEQVNVGPFPVEFMSLEYANGDKLYVPVTSLHLISRYVGTDEDHAPLHRLGSEQWKRAKSQAAKKIFDVAAELLNMYARRELNQSFQFPITGKDFQLFCDQCSFELTDDQDTAVNDVLSDMTKILAMDRLVCGDVGFGKTEVAMRAAFHAVNSGKQVAVLVPTTLLAQQHYDTFRDRFAAWPVEIEVLSRLRTKKDADRVLQRLSTGAIDILIGTHQLLSDGVQFEDLGLLVVDEEHRFGVRHKERIRQFRANVDLLTLTATPIPRTLNLALEGVRDLSIIGTPPAKRLSIKTFVAPSNDVLVQDAITRELDRGGQVYFLHNRVRTIVDCAERLQKLVPNARIGVAHGELNKPILESVMSDFYHRHCNLLVCTTIIESGIDIPNANTIVIDRADKLGLAQLHQLRGRVGRSHKQAYAYLMTPYESLMTRDASLRLEAIEAADELGAGFTLALHDLEIRGAGEILGEEQSGQIEDIGFSLYMQMLEETVDAMRSNRVPNLDKPFDLVHQVEFGVPTLIPSDYIPDVSTRLILYRRIANARSNFELDKMNVEIIDRFGRLPDAVTNLFRVSRIKLMAADMGVRSIDVGHVQASITLVDTSKFDATKLLSTIQKSPDRFHMKDNTTLVLQHEFDECDDRFLVIEEFLESIRLRPEAQEKAA